MIYSIDDPHKHVYNICNKLFPQAVDDKAFYTSDQNTVVIMSNRGVTVTTRHEIIHSFSKFLKLMKNYNKELIIAQLNRRVDVRIVDNTIYILNGKDPKHPKRNDVGNSSLGKIDFLVNYCKFTISEVTSFPQRDYKPTKN